MKTRKGTCTEDLFWEAVAEIGWGTKTTDYKVVERGILKNWDNEFISSFDDLLHEFRNKLAAKVETFEERKGVSCGCGDDGFSDLTNHVVGLGKEEYEAAMKDPMLVVKRGQKYTESFSYCIPHLPAQQSDDLTLEEAKERVRKRLGYAKEDIDEDVDLFLEEEALELVFGPKVKLMPQRYALWAKRELPGLKALWQSEYAGLFSADQLIEGQYGLGLVDIICLLDQVVKGNVEVLLQHPDLPERIRALREKRDRAYSEKRKELEVLVGDWGLDNMINDVQRYLGEKS